MGVGRYCWPQSAKCRAVPVSGVRGLGADSKIVCDKFHVVKHLHKAVDRVRRGEHRVLKREGDERLTGSKYLWLRRPTELSAAAARPAGAGARGLQGRPGVGAQGTVPHLLGVPLPRGGADVLHPLVLAGDAQPAQAPGRRRQADPAASTEPAHLPASSRDQRRPRGHQRRHPVGEEDGPRLPQCRARQDGHLLPLRRSRSLPTRNPVEPSDLEEKHRSSEVHARSQLPYTYPTRARNALIVQYRRLLGVCVRTL